VGGVRPEPADVQVSAAANLTSVVIRVMGTAHHGPPKADTAHHDKLITTYEGLIDSGLEDVVTSVVGCLPALCAALGSAAAQERLLPALLAAPHADLKRRALLPHVADLSANTPWQVLQQLLDFALQGVGAEATSASVEAPNSPEW
jgi:hypothetical protein